MTIVAFRSAKGRVLSRSERRLLLMRRSLAGGRLVRRSPLLLLTRQFERAPQDPQGPVDVAGGIQVHADPARLRQDVVRLRLSRFHQLVANALRQRDVDQEIPVYVPDLAPAELVLETSEPVGRA